jgi:CDP-glucose 4,6-dehydratase
MGSQLRPRVLNEATNEIRHQYLSAEKARRVLGWRPLYSLEEGLRATIAWYESFMEEESCSTLLRKAG